GLFGTTGFNLGLDNPFLPANVVTAIRNNVRPVYDLRQTVPNPSGGPPIPNPAFGAQTGTLADPRAFYRFFGPGRPQNNTRELERYVIGVRGDRDRLGFIDNFSYEASYTYGEVRNQNVESALDSERFFFALDTVRGANGQIQCRVQALAAAGVTITDQTRRFISPATGDQLTRETGRPPNLAANDPTITGCVPINPFGADFRQDANAENITGGGGRPGLTAAQLAYVTASVNVQEMNKQQDFLGFVSGELLDGVLPAGPIGVALGYEFREEKFSGIGRTASNFDERGRRRLLFLNTSFDNPEVGYQSNEVFGEIRVPLLRDLPLVDTAEVSAAYRKAENSVESVGELETYSVQALYRPNRDLLFRATYGEAVRIPTLSNLFNQGFQTFAFITDPCDATVIRNTADPVIRANRRANCVTLLGPGYDPDTTAITYTQTVEGRGGAGSPLLTAEDSRSYTFSVSFTPRFIPRFSLVLDYYNINVANAIQVVTAGTNVNNCVSGATINQAACATFVRNGLVPPPGSTGQVNQPFAVTSFAQGAQNFAARTAQGMDFNARYAIDTADLLGRDLGRIDYSLRGTYNIRQEFFENINDPSDATENDATPGQPRVRLLSTVTYSPVDRLSLTWDWDYQTSQELFDSDLLVQDPDERRAEFLETGSFSTHDFSARYELRDGFTIRGGVINAFDAEPPAHVQQATVTSQGIDVIDLFGRRFFVGANLEFGGARN
ncbi:MAG: TonB-dependent receptor, partial [Proteobacteria bacterium]|nr:TonB-dependent receptor [Pseudomonadota bacterium]